MFLYRFKYTSGPDFSIKKVHDEKFNNRHDAECFACGMGAAGARVKEFEIVRIRLRRYIGGRVVCSQIFDSIDDAFSVGSTWAGDSGRNTYAISEARAPKA